MSCLFNSLSKYVENESMGGNELRKIICDFLETNPLLIDDMSAETIINNETNLSLADYVNQMRRYDTFGGAIEIRCFTKIFKLNVMVKSLPNKKDIEFVENTNFLWSIISWSGGHFEALRS